jgi:hypothetical protein
MILAEAVTCERTDAHVVSALDGRDVAGNFEMGNDRGHGQRLRLRRERAPSALKHEPPTYSNVPGALHVRCVERLRGPLPYHLSRRSRVDGVQATKHCTSCPCDTHDAIGTPCREAARFALFLGPLMISE